MLMCALYVRPLSLEASGSLTHRSTPTIGPHTELAGGTNHADQMSYETMAPEVRSISPAQEEIAGDLSYLYHQLNHIW
jgi:hypothetical protein